MLHILSFDTQSLNETACTRGSTSTSVRRHTVAGMHEEECSTRENIQYTGRRSWSSYCIEGLLAIQYSGGHLLRANLIRGTMKWTATLTYSYPSIYSSLKTIWRRSSTANIWLWFLLSSKNTIETVTSNNHIKQKSGSRIWYSLYKGWESVSSLHYDMHFMAVKQKEQSDKQSSIITTSNQKPLPYPLRLSLFNMTSPQFVTQTP